MKKLNPSYSQMANNNIKEFTNVVHVPVLPPALPNFEDSIYFLKTDAKFYHCVKIDDKWTWERVTYGPSRIYVLPVNKIVPLTHKEGTVTIEDYNFNDQVDAIRRIISGLERYDDHFDPLPTEGTVTPKIAVAKYNEISKYINRINHATLTIINIDDVSETLSGMSAPGYTGITLKQFNTYLNELIGELNPHAEASELYKQVGELTRIMNGITDTGTWTDVQIQRIALCESDIEALGTFQESAETNLSSLNQWKTDAAAKLNEHTEAIKNLNAAVSTSTTSGQVVRQGKSIDIIKEFFAEISGLEDPLNPADKVNSLYSVVSAIVELAKYCVEAEDSIDE